MSAMAVLSLNDAILIYKAQRCCAAKHPLRLAFATAPLLLPFATDLCNRSLVAAPFLITFAAVNCSDDPLLQSSAVLHA